MMSLSRWVGAAVFVLLAGMAALANDVKAPPEKSDGTVAGVVAAVGDGKITVTADGKDQVLAVAKDADVICDGKACKLEDIKKGASVAVTLKKSGDSTVATKIEAKSAGAVPAGEGLSFKKADANDDTQLWTMQKEGDDVVLISKTGKSALDARNRKGKPYLNEQVDGKNSNQLWTVKVQGDYAMLLTKDSAGTFGTEGKGALDAGGLDGELYIHPKPDPGNDNHLWTLEKHGDFYMLLPKGHKVALSASAAK
jgi:hypothetical protein